MPDEVWNEVHDIVQETGIKTIPMEKKCKTEKWLSGEALQIAVKSKGEMERYTHFAFLHFFSMGMVLIPVSGTVSRPPVHSSPLISGSILGIY